MSEWQLLVLVIAIAVAGRSAYSVLSDIRTEVRIIRERTEAHTSDASNLSSRLDGVATMLERLTVLTKYPYLLGAYSLDDLAWQRETCAFLFGKVQWHVSGVAGATETEKDAAVIRIEEEDRAQCAFQYRKLSLMIQANNRVAAGLESIRDARLRVETELGKSPHPGAEIGSGTEYWNTTRLVEKLLSNGAYFRDVEGGQN